MGKTLVKFYEFVDENCGLVGKIELAKLTKIPSPIAVSAPDSPENVMRFTEAVRKITGKTPPIV